MILSIPVGKVSSYGRVAAAAGYPRYHRAVAKLLRMDPVDQLPWHRILGAGGEIKLRGDAAHEQRARLKLERVEFDGERVNMEKFEHSFKPWEVYIAPIGSRNPYTFQALMLADGEPIFFKRVSEWWWMDYETCGWVRDRNSGVV